MNQCLQRDKVRFVEAEEYLSDIRTRFHIQSRIVFALDNDYTAAWLCRWFGRKDCDFLITMEPIELCRCPDRVFHYLLAHEMGHVLFYDFKQSWDKLTPKRRSEEQDRANAFALQVASFQGFHEGLVDYLGFSEHEARQVIARAGALRLKLSRQYPNIFNTPSR